MMKLILQIDGRSITIEYDNNEDEYGYLPVIIKELIIPALIGIQFSQATINKFITNTPIE